jgi:replicative DNA helicase Mcm
LTSLEILTDSAIVDEFKTWIDTAYIDTVSSLAFSENPNFVIDYNKILSFNAYDLPKHFENNIDQAIDALKQALSEKMFDEDIMHENTSNKPENINVRIQNYDEPLSLRDITVINNKKMIVVNAVIAKASEEKPITIKTVFLCAECGHHEPSPKNRLIKKCPSCEAEGSMVLDVEKCVFTPARQIVIQDLPEDLPAGHIPISKNVIVMGGDLTHSDICRPGSRVKLTAIVRLGYDKNTADDLKNNLDVLGILDAPSTGITFNLTMTANNIEKLGDSDDLQQNHNKISKEDIEKIQSYKKNPELNDILTNSFAPHIYGHEPIKECLLLALVSSSGSQGDIKKRGDINILLVGNAGVAKSQMLLYAAKVSPRCIYVSGRGSSGVGLTAAVTKDEKTGSMMLEAGAAVLADQGVLISDEFDKLKADDRSALHEIMEQQTCSVAKAGIVATLNARISLLAAANPKYGTYDSYKTLAENTDYPPSLISRFDFIFVIKDVVDEANDLNIAKAILKGFNNSATTKLYIDVKFLAKYLQYVKSLPDPQLSDEAINVIEKHYITLRKRSEQDKDGTVVALTVTARLVDTLKRASIARAKLLQKDTVTTEDVHRAIKLLSEMYRSFGIEIPDSESPNLSDNVNKIETINLGLLYGKPLTKMNKMKVFNEIVNAITNEGKEEKIDIDHLAFELVNTRKFVTRYDADDFIRQAIRAGVLTQIKGNTYRYNKDTMMSS